MNVCTSFKFPWLSHILVSIMLMCLWSVGQISGFGVAFPLFPLARQQFVDGPSVRVHSRYLRLLAIALPQIHPNISSRV